MTTINNPIKELIKKAANDFAKDFEESRKLFENNESRNGLSHAGEFGSYREKIVANLIEKFLPKHFSLGEGFIVNTCSEKTKQVDIVIYDADNTPKLETAGARFFPYETVVALGEVKSTLTTSTLSKALATMRENKKIRECTPENPFPVRPAGLSEAIVHHLATVRQEDFNIWGNFEGLMNALNAFKDGRPPTTLNESSDYARLVYNPRYFEELNVVTFLVCDEITDFKGKTDSQLKELFFTLDTAIEHLGFNLILSVKDGLILHCKFENGDFVASPFPKHRNTKSTIFIKTPEANDNSHIMTFVSMLLHAISTTATFEFSPLPYLQYLNKNLDRDPSMRRIFE